MSNRPNPISSLSYLSQFLILIGAVMVSAVAFTMLGLYIAHSLYGVNLESLADLVNTKTPSPEEITSLKIIQTFSAIGAFLVPALAAPGFFKENTRNYLRIKNTTPKLWLLSGLLILAIIPFNSFLIEISKQLAEIIGSTSLAELQKQQEDTMRILLNMDSIPQYLLNLLLIAALPAVSEELLFRGVGLSLFKRWTGNMHVAIIIQGLFFGAMHQQIQSIIPLVFFGILLGYIVWYTGSIWCGVLIHFINNGLAVTAYYFMKDDSMWEKMVNDNFPLYLSIISLILSAGIFYLIWKNRTKEELTVEIE